MVEFDVVLVLVGGDFGVEFARVGYVLDEILPIRLEKRAHLLGQGIHGFVGDQTFCVLAPSISACQRKRDERRNQQETRGDTNAHQCVSPLRTSSFAVARPLCRRP